MYSYKSLRSGMSAKTTQLAFSDQDPDFMVGPSGEPDGAVFLGMRGKPGVTKLNLLAIPLTLFLSLAAQADIL